MQPALPASAREDGDLDRLLSRSNAVTMHTEDLKSRSVWPAPITQRSRFQEAARDKTNAESRRRFCAVRYSRHYGAFPNPGRRNFVRFLNFSAV